VIQISYFISFKLLNIYRWFYSIHNLHFLIFHTLIKILIMSQYVITQNTLHVMCLLIYQQQVVIFWELKATKILNSKMWNSIISVGKCNIFNFSCSSNYCSFNSGVLLLRLNLGLWNIFFRLGQDTINNFGGKVS
jgi:hypothetical protein